MPTFNVWRETALSEFDNDGKFISTYQRKWKVHGNYIEQFLTQLPFSLRSEALSVVVEFAQLFIQLLRECE